MVGVYNSHVYIIEVVKFGFKRDGVTFEIGFVGEFNFWGKVFWDGKFWAQVRFNVSAFKEGKSVRRCMSGRRKGYYVVFMI